MYDNQEEYPSSKFKKYCDNVIYVNSVHGDNYNDGLSEANAVRSIQQAINIAKYTNMDTNICIMACNECNENIIINNQHVRFTLLGNSKLNNISIINESFVSIFTSDKLDASLTFNNLNIEDSHLYIYHTNLKIYGTKLILNKLSSIYCNVPLCLSHGMITAILQT